MQRQDEEKVRRRQVRRVAMEGRNVKEDPVPNSKEYGIKQRDF
jgi:hypothetical protein